MNGGPTAGWYDDPQRPGHLRWWDGEAWTEDTQPSPASVAASLAAARAASSPAPAERNPLPWIVGGMILLAALLATALLLSSSGGDDDGGGSGDPIAVDADPLEADAEAQNAVRTAQTALETYALDHNGSYASAGIEELTAIEPTVTDVSVDAQADTYTLAATSEATGNTFTVTRNADGSISLTCTEPGSAGCPAGGTWG